jgi:L-threonylcarbamoyladenylate synthase
MALDLSQPKLQTLVIPSNTPDALQRIAVTLKEGKIAAFPTDTVYAAGAVASNLTALAQLYAIKQRRQTKPITILVSGVEQLRQVVESVDPFAQKLIDRFWPGALTLILPRNPAQPAIGGGGSATVAVRMPAHVLTLALLREVGAPIAATSANLSGTFSPLDAQEALLHLDGKIKLILDGGPCPGGVDSTVVDTTGGAVKVLRESAISARDIYQALQK